MAKLALALDTREFKEAVQILEEIKYKNIIIKIGYALFIKHGVDVIKIVKDKGFELFLDLKLHDIPNTVYNGVLSAVENGVDYLTVHILGGEQMLKKAVEAKKNSNLKLLGVTILTSHTQEYLNFLKIPLNLEELVLKLAKTGLDTGIDGLVCSTEEVQMLKTRLEKDFIAVVPGIRPEGTSNDDQKRVATPSQAVSSGADIIVVGRPILKSDNKNKTIEKILGDIEKR
ncbi:MAG: orotidine-5'-phosphate decarboxylase [Aquificae bacterium]|nr:orotidine-5'-phosphate decarboxylase [Aquificota bacterium]